MRDILKVLRSVKLGLALLAIVGIASMIGTRYPMEESLRLVFRSWWFTALLMALAVNVTLASWRTLTVTVPADAKPYFIQSEKAFSGLAVSRDIEAPDASPEALEGALASARARMEGMGYEVHDRQGQLCGMKGMQSRMGALVSHLGLIVIVLGAWGQFFLGVEGFVSIVEGGSVDSFYFNEDLRGAGGNPPKQPLGATIRLDDFEMLVHPQSGIPGKFISHISIREDGEVRSGHVEVNHTEKIGGYILHQNNRGPVDELERYLVGFDLSDGDGRQRVAVELNIDERKDLGGGDMLSLSHDKKKLKATVAASDGSIRVFSLKDAPGGMNDSPHGAPGEEIEWGGGQPLSVELTRFVPHLSVGANSTISSASDEWKNPAIEIALYLGEHKVKTAWLFYRSDLRGFSMASDLPYAFTCVRLLPEGVAEMPPPTDAKLADLRPRLEVRDADENLVATVVIEAGKRVALPAVAPEEEVSDEDASSSAGRALDYTLAGFERVTAYHTGLGVSRNPGIGLIYAGCFLLSIGPIVAFSSRRRWLLVSIDAKRGRAMLGGRPRRRRELIERDLENVHQAMREALS